MEINARQKCPRPLPKSEVTQSVGEQIEVAYRNVSSGFEYRFKSRKGLLYLWEGSCRAGELRRTRRLFLGKDLISLFHWLYLAFACCCSSDSTSYLADKS